MPSNKSQSIEELVKYMKLSNDNISEWKRWVEEANTNLTKRWTLLDLKCLGVSKQIANQCKPLAGFKVNLEVILNDLTEINKSNEADEMSNFAQEQVEIMLVIVGLIYYNSSDQTDHLHLYKDLYDHTGKKQIGDCKAVTAILKENLNQLNFLNIRKTKK